MWSELFIWNKEKLIAEMDNFIAHFEALKQDIANEDKPAMRELMQKSTKRRALFDKPNK